MKLRRRAAPPNAFVESIWVAPAQPAPAPADLALPTATVELVSSVPRFQQALRHAERTPSQYMALQGERPNHPALPT